MSESLHYVCPHCHTTNRIASDQLGNQPDCGSCHQPLVTGEPVALDNDSFARHTGRSQLPVVVDFWAPWCGPCKMIAPILDEVSKDYADKLQVAKMNVDDNREVPAKFGIRGIPTLMIFKNGNIEATKVGALSKSQLAAFIDSNL